ncbi:MAG: hypothetical protein IH604_15990 [Burkholderiales bacterium]|nr:hypothetical protein [Burkholderiales bacterium]
MFDATTIDIFNTVAKDSLRLSPNWSAASTKATDLSLHQIAPYIGRMKTSMAKSLMLEYTNAGDLVVDPFCGCGVAVLEAAANGRRVVAGDWNPYAVLLTKAKLFPPSSLDAANRRLQATWVMSQRLHSDQDLRKIPTWVRQFFHPETLRTALAFRDACVARGDIFLLACFLGVLHHQRPGFLSYPSSHLVPYLRDRRFPREQYPEMYKERDVLSRMQAKIRRTFKRPVTRYTESRRVLHVDAREFPRLRQISAVITSPPYMNELDYVRDNRLRLWFIDRSLPQGLELKRRDRESEYRALLMSVCSRLASGIKPGGYIILVVGDATRGSGRPGRTDFITRKVFESEPTLQVFGLEQIYSDIIPNIRRSRRECTGTKSETVLIYKKASTKPKAHGSSSAPRK